MSHVCVIIIGLEWLRFKKINVTKINVVETIGSQVTAIFTKVQQKRELDCTLFWCENLKSLLCSFMSFLFNYQKEQFQICQLFF